MLPHSIQIVTIHMLFKKINKIPTTTRNQTYCPNVDDAIVTSQSDQSPDDLSLLLTADSKKR